VALLPCDIITAVHSTKWKWLQKNDQLEVAAAVVACSNTAVQHCHSSMQCKMEVAEYNQLEVAAVMVAWQ